PSFERLRARGALSEDMVASFRAVQADPFYGEIAAEGAKVNDAAAHEDHGPEIAWKMFVDGATAALQRRAEALQPLVAKCPDPG
ncbi:MAG TPA: hypothetical protein VFH51_01270, partial [Myxococcota bacterium]|nr:hypothetical protein [Myxococcota bacterium]